MAITCPLDPPVMLITYRLQLEQACALVLDNATLRVTSVGLFSTHSIHESSLYYDSTMTLISWVRNQSDKKIESWVESESSHDDRHLVQSWVPGKLSPSWLAYPLKGMTIFGVPIYILQRKNSIQIHTTTPTSMAVWREMRRRTMSPMSWGEPRLL